MTSRYTSYDSRSSTSSFLSDPSSSMELYTKHKSPAICNTSSSSSSSSRAVVKAKQSDLSVTKTKTNNHNFATMVKKFMEKKSSTAPLKKPAALAGRLVVPCNLIAEDLKRTARKGTNFGGLQRKLFGKGVEENPKKKEMKTLTEVKGNTRTLAMVLRSERELLSLNKENDMELAQLKLMLDQKTKEVDKLKDLCLKQREDIKALKDAILFPDVVNSHLQELLEKQGSELKQANHVLPTLQRQVTSLTGQLQCLAEGLAEVKAEKYCSRECSVHSSSSPRTPTHDYEDANDSLGFGSSDPFSPDDSFLNDLNPCLTPYSIRKRCEELDGASLLVNNMRLNDVAATTTTHLNKLSRSSDYCQTSNHTSKMAHKSDELKATYGRKKHY